MEYSAYNSSNKVLAIGFAAMFVILVLSLAATLFLVIQNRTLAHEQRTIVTPMGYNAPFAVTQNRAGVAYLEMMAGSFIALRLNVSPETVDAQHLFLLSFFKPGAQPAIKVMLAEEAARIKSNEVNSAFYQTSIKVYPQANMVDIRGMLKTWIGSGKPFSELKHYVLKLDYQDGMTRIEQFKEVDDAAQ
ncbi:type IV conjugative transfer system protein TraE [Nissabacter sp. SGAir0207]|uniref:type IV conjugative transfer system protein TraE n=1 Tax=Nissabacter sp. SGAir0207 TaxID=2126321 RepID=UPI0010CD1011|nr:type IV conjugative transfer system protein TraE [Nissabacter sp. SGAir0207]QCR38919.1 type IV conjugative transfer system protein TraE [Nissabacter sp. SGAir0207]